MTALAAPHVAIQVPITVFALIIIVFTKLIAVLKSAQLASGGDPCENKEYYWEQIRPGSFPATFSPIVFVGVVIPLVPPIATGFFVIVITVAD